MWKNRLKKFKNNPWVLWSFIKHRLYYRFIADKVYKLYKDTKFLNGSETIQTIIDNNQSIIRSGDGTFGYLEGASIFFNNWQFTYNKKFAHELKMVLQNPDNLDILYCYPHQFTRKTKRQFIAENIANEWSIWVVTKVLLPDYIKKGVTYGDALCFHPRYNPNIDFFSLRKYFSEKNIIIITNNTNRFKKNKLGKTTHFIEAPSSDAWKEYRELETKILKLIQVKNFNFQDTLIMVSAAEAAKVMVYNLSKLGYTAWDTGQFFDLVTKEIGDIGS